jgi:hypothetical protein
MRNKGQQPNCNICEKYDCLEGTAWNGFTNKNKYYFECYQTCKSFCTLPRSGGYDKQDPTTMKMFRLLDVIFKSDQSDNDAITKLMSKMFGGK